MQPDGCSDQAVKFKLPLGLGLVGLLLALGLGLGLGLVARRTKCSRGRAQVRPAAVIRTHHNGATRSVILLVTSPNADRSPQILSPTDSAENFE